MGSKRRRFVMTTGPLAAFLGGGICLVVGILIIIFNQKLTEHGIKSRNKFLKLRFGRLKKIEAIIWYIGGILFCLIGIAVIVKGFLI